MKLLSLSLLFLLAFILNGCGEDEGGEEGDSTTASSKQGWHFQGRDCQACHNVDLGSDKHLLIGGTLYKSSTVSNQDDIANTCGGEYLVKFLDNNGNTIYNSNDYKDVNSKGYKGKGNIFILQRKLRLLSAGTYYAQITDPNNSVMAISGYSHSFTSQDYDMNNPSDYANRLSCNSCHRNGGPQAPLYVQQNQSLCK